METYDLIVIGAGPAGLSAAIYAARYKLKTLVLGNVFDNSAAKAPLIENYPGFASISGAELLMKFKEQVEMSGVEIKEEDALEIKKGAIFEIITEKSKYNAKSIILAQGTKRRKLNVPGEEKLFGKGVTYCVTCDGPMLANKDVAIIGGGDSAFSAAFMMLDYAKKIYMIDVEKNLRAKPSSIEALKKEKRAEFFNLCKVNAINGKNFVESIEIENVETKKKQDLKVQGVIVEVGMLPTSELAKKLGLKLSKGGFVITDLEMKTNISGVFAAGDLRESPLRQIVVSAGDGAVAAHSAYEYLKKK
ncbi:MAG: FAD-dependent oxidoreductase [Candidatus Paceibacterota bacterium]